MTGTAETSNPKNTWARSATELLSRPLHLLDDRIARLLKGRVRTFKSVQRLHDAAVSSLVEQNHFYATTLHSLAIRFVTSGIGAAVFDETNRSPLLLVANHPYGLIDAFILGALLESSERPFKIFANEASDIVLAFADLLEKTRDHFLLLELDNPKAAKKNLGMLRDAQRMLEEGTSVIIFPAGHRSRPYGLDGDAVDNDWHDSFIRLLDSEREDVRLVPIFFEKKNNVIDQMTYLFALKLIDHKYDLGNMIRGNLTARQTARPQTVQVRIGKPLTLANLQNEVAIRNPSAKTNKKQFAKAAAMIVREKADSLHIPPPRSMASQVVSWANFIGRTLAS